MTLPRLLYREGKGSLEPLPQGPPLTDSKMDHHYLLDPFAQELDRMVDSLIGLVLKIQRCNEQKGSHERLLNWKKLSDLLLPAGSGQPRSSRNNRCR
jgi:hypothetical protein